MKGMPGATGPWRFPDPCRTGGRSPRYAGTDRRALASCPGADLWPRPLHRRHARAFQAAARDSGHRDPGKLTARSARSLSIDRGPRGTRVEITHADLFDLDLNRDLNWLEARPAARHRQPTVGHEFRAGNLGEPQPASPSQFQGPARHRGANRAPRISTLAEAVWFKLVFELADQAPTIAILCKTSVARSLLQFAHRAGLPVIAASIHRIDAARWFGAVVGACLFQVTLGPGSLATRSLFSPSWVRPSRNRSWASRVVG